MYKVLFNDNGRLLSSNANINTGYERETWPEEIIFEYKLNEWNLAPKNSLGFFVFTDLNHARKFSNENYFSHVPFLEIWECEVKNLVGEYFPIYPIFLRTNRTILQLKLLAQEPENSIHYRRYFTYQKLKLIEKIV